MSHSNAQDSQQEIEARQRETSSGIPSDPIGCYVPLLLMALMGLIAIHLSLTTLLTRLNLNAFLLWINTPMAVLYGGVVSGLVVCGLLKLWLGSRRVALVVTVLLAIVWIASLTRYVQVESGIPKVLVVLLAAGIPAILALWFLRPMEMMGAGLLSFGWLLLWGLLVILLRQYLAGLVLLSSLVTSGAIFLLGLYVASGSSLPLPGREHWRKTYNFLRDYVLGVNYPAYVVVDGRRDEDKIEERLPGKRFSQLAAGPGFVISDCDHAVVISSGTKFKGVYGPGVTYTEYADRVSQTIDLRPQLRAFHVEALTRDGIKIRVLVFAPGKIDSRGRQPELGEPLPYNKGAAFKAVHAQRVEHESNRTTRRMWDDLIRVTAERVLQDVISEYDFDDLYGPYQPGGEPPRKTIAKGLCEKVAEELEPLGIHLVGGGISDLQPADPQVYVKRVRSWQAEWKRKVMLKKAKGQAEWLRMVERARAEAQADLILSLGRQLEELSVARAEFHPETALTFLVTILDELMRGQPMLGQIVPGETLQALLAIRQALGGE